MEELSVRYGVLAMDADLTTNSKEGQLLLRFDDGTTTKYFRYIILSVSLVSK